jgi:hypothetical protein
MKQIPTQSLVVFSWDKENNILNVAASRLNGFPEYKAKDNHIYIQQLFQGRFLSPVTRMFVYDSGSFVINGRFYPGKIRYRCTALATSPKGRLIIKIDVAG